jgi:hypothetical protein
MAAPVKGRVFLKIVRLRENLDNHAVSCRFYV